MANYATPAEYVTWMGHASKATLVAKFGESALAADVAAGLLEASRLGGFVASRKAEAKTFGRAYVARIDRLAGL